MKNCLQLLLLILPLAVWGNVFLHNPRGSNNRGCETNTDRVNGAKLFRSDNNPKGGYACPYAWPFACYRVPNERDREQCNEINADQPYDNITGILLDEGGVTHPSGTRTPQLYFYEGSVLQIEWTNSHGCGENPRTGCNIVIQYACEDTLQDDCGIDDSGKTCKPRDGRPITNSNNDTRGSASFVNYRGSGTSSVSRRQRDREVTAQIPYSTSNDAQQDLRFSRHEGIRYYEKCLRRERNKGLWVGDRQLGDRAVHTRQNNGGRYGFECSEEADYYPYWAPSPWKDIAILTNNVENCIDYLAGSQNTNPKYECDCPTCSTNTFIPNNQAGCVSSGGTWRQVAPHNIPAPFCGQSPTTRENHLGNNIGGGKSASAYNWTVPSALANSKTCFIRIRYNITTTDGTLENPDIPVSVYGTATQNSFNSPIRDRRTTTGEPLVYSHTIMGTNKTRLGLAVQPQYFGHTYQDRSYAFEIRQRSNTGECANRQVFNLNVRGKRGNIVQTFPAVEYDFTPNELYLDDIYSCVHVQWTGSDYNPARNANDAYGGPPDPNDLNDGRADRHNMVQMYNAMEYQTVVSLDYDWFMFSTTRQRKVNLAWIGQPVERTEECMTIDSILSLSGIANADNDLPANQQNALYRDNGQNFLDDNNDRDRYYKNCGKLSGAKTPYFDGGLFAPGPPGDYAYMSTRGNSFSNRNQQGIIRIQSGLVSTGSVAALIGGVAAAMGLAGIAFMRRKNNKRVLPPTDGGMATARNAIKSMVARAKPNSKTPGTTASTTVVAQYDHVPGEAGELAFKKGDVITVLSREDEGWWEGVSPKGERGIFPSNYVS